MNRLNNNVAVRPLRIVVVEDEDEFCQFLCAELAQFPNVEVIGSASQIDDVYELIYHTRPDGVFMDIKIIGGDAFQVFAATKRALDPNGILNPAKLGLDSPWGALAW